jgi:hypothetical protein
MSGIEIAGIVLGGFPLLISALEHYRDGAEAFSDFLNFKHVYKKCRRDVKYLQLCFEGTLKDCLLPLVVDDDALGRLVSDPLGKEWKDQSLETLLKKRLPESYGLYMEMIEEINDIMAKLKEELVVEEVISGAEVRVWLHLSTCFPNN